MRILASLVFALGISTPAAFSQAALPPPPPCDGAIVSMRVSEITPAGSMEKMKAAIRAQQAWYASHGLPDKIFSSDVLINDPSTHELVYSDKQIITYHFMPPNVTTEPQRDAAFDAFVKLFQATSTIKESHTSCVPRAMSPFEK